MTDLQRIRMAECPTCGNADAQVTHGLLDDKLRGVHLWNCPECGENIVILTMSCPICEAVKRQAGQEPAINRQLPTVTFRGNVEIEAILPTDREKLQSRPFAEVIRVDADRRWLMTCNGSAMVVHPFDELEELEESGHVFADDVARVRTRGGKADFQMAVRPGGEYPQIDKIIRDRVLGPKYIPVAVLDGDALHRIVAGICRGDIGRIVMLYVEEAALRAYAQQTEYEQPPSKTPDEYKPVGVGVLVVPAFKGDDDTRSWGFLMHCGGGHPPLDLLAEVIDDTDRRLSNAEQAQTQSADAQTQAEEVGS